MHDVNVVDAAPFVKSSARRDVNVVDAIDAVADYDLRALSDSVVFSPWNI